ncbi:MAG: BLUF domain-containing protein [Vicingaceae bacterium]
MNQELFQLTYHSIANDNLEKKDIDNLLKQSERNNKKKHITGCLLYSQPEFIQLLEGEQEEVEELYQKIKQDERHQAVTLLSSNQCEKRTFPNWLMAYHKLDDSEPEDQKVIHNFNLFAKVTQQPTESYDVFWRMVNHLTPSAL